jgi:hypothetical protein
MDITKFASSIIFESDLQHDLPHNEVPKIVDGAIWIDGLELTEEERQAAIDKVIELLPKEGWGIERESPSKD